MSTAQPLTPPSYRARAATHDAVVVDDVLCAKVAAEGLQRRERPVAQDLVLLRDLARAHVAIVVREGGHEREAGVAQHVGRRPDDEQQRGAGQASRGGEREQRGREQHQRVGALHPALGGAGGAAQRVVLAVRRRLDARHEQHGRPGQQRQH